MARDKQVFGTINSAESPVETHGQCHGIRSALKRNVVVVVLLVIPVIAAYANTLSVPFYLDDFRSIVNNPKIRITEISWDSLSNFELRSRPVSYVSFALNYYFHQYDLAGYHIVNVIVHFLSGIFLFFLARETITLAAPGKDKCTVTVIAFWATLLWLVNPLCTSAVTYVVQRMTSLAAMFCVLSLLIYVHGRLAAGRKRWICYALALLAWLLALGCKQIAIPLPVFVLLYELFFFNQFDAAWLKRNLKYFLVVVVLFAGLSFVFLGTAPLEAYWAAYKGPNFTPAQRFFTEFRVVVTYLTLFFFPYPDRLLLDYDFPLSYGLFDPISTFFSMVMVFGLLGTAFRLARKHPLFSFAIFWYFGNLLLESIWPTSIIFEHKAYLPTMFLFVPICDWSFRLVEWKRLSVAAFLIAGMFGLWTYQRNLLWQDPVALWQQCVDKNPGKAESYNGLGDALFKLGKHERALPLLREAVRLDPHFSDALNNLGSCLYEQGQYAEAIGYFKKAIALKSDHAVAHVNLALSYQAVGEIENSIVHFKAALSLDPGNARISTQLQNAINYAEALRARSGGASR